MMYRTFLDLGVWPAWTVVKVDDTEVGIAEGLNAGAWTVGVALTGNVFGLNPAETDALDAAEYHRMRDLAYSRLIRAGAHYVIDSVADLDAVLDEIEGALARGERP
jgi:phosphonoacetaldehyde hydrolase